MRLEMKELDLGRNILKMTNILWIFVFYDLPSTKKKKTKKLVKQKLSVKTF
jgi:hypothetical protein